MCLHDIAVLVHVVCEKKMLLLKPVKAAAAVIVAAELLLDVTHWCEKEPQPARVVPGPRE